MKLHTTLSRGLTALPLLFVLATVALDTPADQATCCGAPVAASASKATDACSENRRRARMFVALMPADLPPRLHGRANSCPV